ncbi:histone-like nucleoid-structuring protein Lsr2 [Streptomyces sp. NPDC054775]
MAQKVVTLYTDDLTGEESSEVSEYTILVNGAGVEIDLTPDSHDQLMEALQPFMQAAGARRVRTSARRGASKKSSDGGPDTAAVRTWARDNGYEINSRGRVPASVVEAYVKAH